MKRLYIRYGDLEIVDADVEEFGFSESDTSGALAINAKLPRQKATAGGGILDALMGARRQSTAQMVEQRRAEFQAETVDADTEETS